MVQPNMELFDSEWAILDVLWKHEPCTAPTVQEALAEEKGWAYATVKTMMDRMVKKGLLDVERIRSMYLYRSAITRRQAQRIEIMRTVRRAFNGMLNPMMQFLLEDENLSDQERADLGAMIQNRKRPKTGGRKKS